VARQVDRRDQRAGQPEAEVDPESIQEQERARESGARGGTPAGASPSSHGPRSGVRRPGSTVRTLGWRLVRQKGWMRCPSHTQPDPDGLPSGGPKRRSQGACRGEPRRGRSAARAGMGEVTRGARAAALTSSDGREDSVGRVCTLAARQVEGLGPTPGTRHFGGAEAARRLLRQRSNAQTTHSVLQEWEAQESIGHGPSGNGREMQRTHEWRKASRSTGWQPGNGEGETACGDAGTAAREGKALKGGGTVGEADEARCETCRGSGNAVNPRVGCRMQQACEVHGGGNRQGGEEPRRRPESGVWQLRTEAHRKVSGRGLQG
jgi:hypothetical protein